MLGHKKKNGYEAIEEGCLVNSCFSFAAAFHSICAVIMLGAAGADILFARDSCLGSWDDWHACIF